MVAGYKTYLVGGSVRDLLVKQTPKDFDVLTTAEPKEVRFSAVRDVSATSDSLTYASSWKPYFDHADRLSWLVRIVYEVWSKLASLLEVESAWQHFVAFLFLVICSSQQDAGLWLHSWWYYAVDILFKISNCLLLPQMQWIGKEQFLRHMRTSWVQVKRTFPGRCIIVGRRFPICHVQSLDTVIEV